MLTKTDFLAYLDCLMHLWALKHNQIPDSRIDEFLQLLIDQGYEVEALAKEYISKYIGFAQSIPSSDIHFEYEVNDGQFEARIDCLIKNPDDSYDIYEIKSSSNLKSKHYQDATFQYLVASKSLNVRNVYLVYLNKDYKLESELNLLNLFFLEKVNQKVQELESAISKDQQEAIKLIKLSEPSLIPTCLKPKECPCLELCHPDLPEYSILINQHLWMT